MPNNASIFNAVRQYMSPEFKARIPKMTVENMKEVSTMLTSDEFKAEFNEWQSQMINRIGLTLFRDYTLTNPLADQIYGDMQFGDAIEEIAADIVTGREMEYGENGKSVDPFIRCDPETKVEYHRIMKPIQYCTTLERDRVKRALLSEGGLERLLRMFVSKLNSSADVDTWLLTKNEMAYYINDAKKATMPLKDSQKVTSEDIVDDATAKKFILQVKQALSAAMFPNRAFNPQGLMKALSQKNYVLFIRADIIDAMEVYSLAAAFNKEMLDLNVKIKKMDDFGIDPNGGKTDDVLAILAEDKKWLLITQQLDELETIYNHRGRYWNYFLTRQMSYGTTYFSDAIIFRKNWTP